MAKRVTASAYGLAAWPGGRVEPPLVDVEPCRLDGDWLVYGSPGAWRGDYRAVPDQLYAFEVEDISLADAEQVAALSARIGRFTPMHDLTGDLPYNVDQHRAALGRFSVEFDGLPLYDPPGADDPAVVGIPELRVHVVEAAYRLRVLQRLGAHAKAHLTGRPVTGAWRDCRSEAHAWHNFTGFTNAALQPFHVRVWLDSGDPDFSIGAARPSAYEVAVLQVVNDVIDEVDFRVCAAEGCDRLFARQRDRSTYYSRSTGVIYCSRRCLNAQAQREWRRRQRAKKKGG